MRKKVETRKRKLFCIKGHEIRFVGRTLGGTCKACSSNFSREFYQENRNYCLKYQQQYNQHNQSKIQRRRKNYRERAPEIFKNNSWKHLGIITNNGRPFTLSDYTYLLVQQRYRCRICKRHKNKFFKMFAVDHDHKTGRARGLLCSSCNTRLGILENATFLEQAQRYLDEYRD